MIDNLTLAHYLDGLLHPETFRDYCPNGLQVEGIQEIETLVTGVSACQALLDRALELNADALLVHHGYFWHGENPRIIGVKRQRLGTLLDHDINLFAYHLPLDAHSKYGNNTQLAQLLDIKALPVAKENFSPSLLDTRWIESFPFFFGELQHPMKQGAFAEHIHFRLGQKPLHIVGQSADIQRIVISSGAAQDFIEIAAELGADAFLTGEASERTTHLAHELGLHFFAAGHHATERYGVQALGKHLAQKFKLQHHFVDIENPV